MGAHLCAQQHHCTYTFTTTRSAQPCVPRLRISDAAFRPRKAITCPLRGQKPNAITVKQLAGNHFHFSRLTGLLHLGAASGTRTIATMATRTSTPKHAVLGHTTPPPMTSTTKPPATVRRAQHGRFSSPRAAGTWSAVASRLHERQPTHRDSHRDDFLRNLSDTHASSLAEKPLTTKMPPTSICLADEPASYKDPKIAAAAKS